MAKQKTRYVCTACGYETARWLGQCPDCEAWNTREEQLTTPEPAQAVHQRARGTGAEALPLSKIEEGEQDRAVTGISELDRVLGGGIVPGSLLLVGGDPGIGKSTLLLQMSAHLAHSGARVLYVSGEESARQIKLRARRLGIEEESLYILPENAMDAVEARFDALSPDYMIVDSIQTMYKPDVPSAPGSVSQVRGCASQLMYLAKTSGCAMFLVGHVTKEGAIAGPRVLEHMVDVVLYFEGDRQHAYRMLRAVKNRFGSINELGLFEMRERGMVEVANPGEMLLSRRAHGSSGSVVLCALEGTRPMLVDLQALVARSPLGMPRRTVDGLDTGRVALLLAVLEKRAGLRLFDQDVFVNVAGGLTLAEPAADLALALAVASSLKDAPVPEGWVVFGEIGLAGEVRGVGQVERRLSECARLGFTHCLLPRESMRGIRVPEGMTLRGVDTLAESLAVLLS